MKLLIPLAAGICLGGKCCTWVLPAWIFPVGMGAILLGSRLFRGRDFTLPFCFILVTGISLGRETPLGEVSRGLITGRICSVTGESDAGTRVKVDRIRCRQNGCWYHARGKASVYLAKARPMPGNRTLHRTAREIHPGILQGATIAGREDSVGTGSRIVAYGRLHPAEPPLNPEQFDYGAYLRGRGVYYHAYFAPGSWGTDQGIQNNGLRIRALDLRQRLMCSLDSRVAGQQRRALLHALLLGYRGDMDPELEQGFLRTGTMHVLAVSGLHVGILYLLPAFLLKRIRRNRGIRIAGSVLVLTSLWMYALLTGLSVSVVRAVCMCCIHGLASLSRRKISPWQVLSLTAFLMLLIRPAALFEAGFQLSFSAVAGIILLYRRILSGISLPGWIGRGIARMISLSLSAQLATVPLSVYYFHRFCPAAVPSSLVVIPVVTLILYLGFLFFIGAGLEPFSDLIGSLLDQLSSVLISFTRSTGNLPGISLEGLSILPFQVLLLYATGFLVLLYLSRTKPAVPFITAGMVIVLLAFSTAREFTLRRQSGICVFALQGETAVGFVDGRQSAVFRGFEEEEDQGGLPWGLEGFFLKRKLSDPFQFSAPGLQSPDSIDFPWHEVISSRGVQAVYFSVQGKRILVIRELRPSEPVKFPSLGVDLLILCNDPFLDISVLKKSFGPALVVADGSNSFAYTERIRAACTEAGIDFRSTRDGAYFF